ncbi:MAG: DNA gyrase/topoisomerase IV subunit A [Bacteroidia bacterium]|nr:DNA gyrase/topoisomerase IV subunit A [Bacteroidia bacterium]MCZ2247995.1 DNA gyrase/topoisomerase IV subunit A [Bacteroidia bacterium]
MSEEESELNHQEEDLNGEKNIQNILPVSGMYKNWFLEYASYVILERAVPAIEDGLKPVQRRILHSMYELEDGRYNKVANIIGNCMKYHPHGDASIGDAIVQIGQKDLLIDCQGNWGNILTGDSAAAARYIEARLSKFGQEVLFNSKTTVWQSSYDGRNKEPITLPVKFPLLLAQGVEGIAVGLACKIMPHNFIELIDGSIDILKGKKVNLLPDFPTGGLADFSNYNEGLRGGKIRIRAKINQLDKKTLVITEIPFGTTTGSLMESIVSANEKEKIKIRKIEDNTAENVEIILHLHPGISPDKTIDALYAFTNCEVSISPNACIIENDKPRFLGVNEMLKISTFKTVDLLGKELQIRKEEIEEAWHFSSLEKIFIEKRIYRQIEECETWEEVIAAIDKGLKPYKKLFKRNITTEDITKLTEIKIKRISKFDSFKADEYIKHLEEELALVQHHLDFLIDYTIEYFRNLKKKYAKGRERRTEIKTFEIINATTVAVANEKLYVNREEGFAGYGMKKDEYVCECSDIDDIIVFRNDGTMTVLKVSDKSFVGKGIIYINVFRKNDDRTIYNMIYRDGTKGRNYVKRFAVNGVTRDKIYDLTKGSKGSEVLYFTANPNGEAEVVTILHKPLPGIRKIQFDFDFGSLAIKGRNSQGNIVTNYPIKKISLKEKGLSTLGARMIWFDDTIQRLNSDGRGTLLGEFAPQDKILYFTQSGYYRLINFDLSNHFDEDMILIEKFNPEKPIAAIYFDGKKKEYYVKRFLIEPTDKKVLFISEEEGSKLELVISQKTPIVEVKFAKNKGTEIPSKQINLADFIAVKGIKAKGNKLESGNIKEINNISPDDPTETSDSANGAPEVKETETNVQIDYDRLERLKSIRNNLDNMDTQMTIDF